MLIKHKNRFIRYTKRALYPSLKKINTHENNTYTFDNLTFFFFSCLCTRRNDLRRRQYRPYRSMGGLAIPWLVLTAITTLAMEVTSYLNLTTTTFLVGRDMEAGLIWTEGARSELMEMTSYSVIPTNRTKAFTP